MEQKTYLQNHPLFKDVLGILIFIACVGVGTVLINTFIFRSFNVNGVSMETTLYTNDRLIVNRVPVTLAQLQNKNYSPQRGQIIVFKNPKFNSGTGEEYLVKRVIAFAGERVVVKDGVLTVYNNEHPEGFQPDLDDKNGQPGSPSSCEEEGCDTTVSEGSIYVAGDHRVGGNSYDSRTGLGLIPLYDVVGPVSARIYPFNKITGF